MSPDATDEDIAQVVTRVESVGGEAFVSKGVMRTIIGLVGDIESFHHLNLRTLRGVADVRRISDPYKLVSRQHHQQRSTVWVGPAGKQVPIGPDTFTFLAGPCVAESAEQTVEAARMAQSAGATILRSGSYRPGVAPHGFAGIGAAGLETLTAIRETTGMPVVTEVIDTHDVEALAEHVDMIQVSARDMSNFGLLQAVAQAGLPVLLRRGMSSTVEEWLMAAEYIAQRGNLDIVLCERGIRTFEQSTRNTLDISSVPVAQVASHLPVIVDPSHAAGRTDLVVPLSRAAIAVGADGIVVDVHADPEVALCEGQQALSGSELRALAQAVRQLPKTVGRLPARDLAR